MSFNSGLSILLGVWCSVSCGLLGATGPYCSVATPMLHCLIDLTYLPLVRSSALSRRRLCTRIQSSRGACTPVCTCTCSRVIYNRLLLSTALYCIVPRPARAAADGGYCVTLAPCRRAQNFWTQWCCTSSFVRCFVVICCRICLSTWPYFTDYSSHV